MWLAVLAALLGPGTFISGLHAANKALICWYIYLSILSIYLIYLSINKALIAGIHVNISIYPSYLSDLCIHLSVCLSFYV